MGGSGSRIEHRPRRGDAREYRRVQGTPRDSPERTAARGDAGADREAEERQLVTSRVLSIERPDRDDLIVYPAA